MIQLHNLGLRKKKSKRVGRGISSGWGKTCGRGEKGDKSRSGYRSRLGYIGGGVRLHMKLPTRGFTRGRFLVKTCALNLSQLEHLFKDGEVVNQKTLHEKKIISKKSPVKIKILSKGDLTKKIKIEAHSFSENAQKKLKEKNIPFKVLNQSAN